MPTRSKKIAYDNQPTHEQTDTWKNDPIKYHVDDLMPNGKMVKMERGYVDDLMPKNGEMVKMER